MRCEIWRYLFISILLVGSWPGLRCIVIRLRLYETRHQPWQARKGSTPAYLHQALRNAPGNRITLLNRVTPGVGAFLWFKSENADAAHSFLSA